MNRIYRLLNQTLLLVAVAAAVASAAQVKSVRLFSEQDYSRLSIGLDGPFVSNVETNPAGKLVFIRFEGVGVDKLSRQSYLYDDSPFLESVSFLPLGGDQVVARVKTRQDFRLKTYETAEPYRLILELSPREIKSTAAPTPKNDSYYQLGLKHLGEGSVQAALTSFRSAIRSGDRVADSYYQAGRIRLRQGQLDKALINFSRATGSRSHAGEANLYLSWIHFKQGERDKMVASWREFVRRVPAAAGRFRIATANPEIDFRSLEDAVTARPDKAVAQVESSPDAVAGENRNSPDAAWYFEQGVAARQDDRLAAAAELLEKAAELDPDDSETHFQLGVVYKGLGRKQASARQFQLSLGTGAKSPDVEQPVLPRSADVVKQVAADNNFDHLEPLIDHATTRAAAGPQSESESSNEDEAAAVAGALDSKAGTPPAAAAVVTDEGVLSGIRGAAAGMINQYGIGLLRRQVEILTGLMGLIFLLTLVAERFFRRRRNNRTSLAGPGLPPLVAAGASSAGGRSAPVIRNSPSPAATKKLQVAQVLARELESKRRASQPVIEEAGDTVELQLKPVGERGMYGVDIARRIKEELSPAGNPVASSALAGRRRDDMQTRLIRQLRSKNWTIGDIAQEMSLSREEIKWALAGNGSERSAADLGDHSQIYGQLSALTAHGRNSRAERIDTERIDREVDLELEINV